MIGGETAVVCRMPILRGDDQRKHGLQPVRDGNDQISLRHSEGATGQKVVLNINQDECIHKLWEPVRGIRPSK